MNVRKNDRILGLASVVVLCLAAASAKGWSDKEKASTPGPASQATTIVPTETRISIDEARRQAEVLHSAMHATLQLVHHRYYREDEGLPIPAAVVKQVFREVKAERGIELRWLVVEGQAMNSDHQAKDAFERDAVQALLNGKPAHEQVAQGTYRRAGPIVLGNACLKCHVPDRKSTAERRAGLIISIPVASP